ncbi:MAG: acyl-ACP--UDP-N-acetylglucosamine O-acyltransferase [Lewinellaceae bacterium]|nr:acyl-ACP--UDP-N-acetylglucosamine O-acyltransferase [Saprospiraceae bacterium]MCB9342930.1 acyl-ACP--UDP-N-acetylglucosamine O-acyltransferase [Lewinellaceae bacterium]
MNYSNGLRDIHPKANIGKNVSIGSFTTIEEDVVIGDGCKIGSNVHIFNGARIGENCEIFPGASISAAPQTKVTMEEAATLEIGNGTIIRECCTLNRGNLKFGGKTTIGENCLLMAYVHIAHDCHIGHDSILANNVTLAGHIEVGSWATLGGMVAVHQFVRIGEQTMIGGGSLVRKDVPPFITVAREPLSYAGINSIGLKRRGFSLEEMHHIEDVYRVLFVKGYSVNKALNIIESDYPSNYSEQISTFVKNAKRGLVKGFRTRTA